MAIPWRYLDCIKFAADHGYPRAVRLMDRHKASPARKAQKAAKAERRKDSLAIRGAVISRADGFCEFCARRNPGPMDWHHLMPGPLRRRCEAESTTVWICKDCHRKWHNNDPETLERSYQIAGDLGAPQLVLDSLRHRIDKLETR